MLPETHNFFLFGLTCVDDLSTQKLENPSCSAIYQNDISEWRSTEIECSDWLIERLFWVERSSYQSYYIVQKFTNKN